MNGAQMAGEMAEQPPRLRQLVERFDAIAERVRAVVPVPLNGITIVARGSSDHAAVYGRYLLEAATGKPESLFYADGSKAANVNVALAGRSSPWTSMSGPPSLSSPRR